MRILMYFCLFALLVSCGKTEEKKDKKPMTVKVFQAGSSESKNGREFNFISKPFKTTDLSFRVSGPVLEFDAQPGRNYRKGEVIAAIDNRDFIIRKEKAEAVYEQAEAEYKRIAALYEKNNMSGSSYEKAKSDWAIAKAAYSTAQNELDDTRLRAPFDGYVQTVYIERFQDVRSSQPIVTFIDLSKVKVETYIPENIAISMRSLPDYSACNLKLSFDAMSGKEYTTSDIEISQSTTANNISFQLTAILDNKDNKLLGGMSGRLFFDVPSGSNSKSIFVPQIAVCHRPETGTYVWTLTTDDRVKITPVETGNLGKGNQVEIVSGLKPQDKVALTGHSFLTDNEKVTVDNIN